MRGRLVVLWVISLISAVAVGAVLVALFQQSSSDRVGRADALASRACDAIVDNYQFYTAGETEAPADLHDPAVQRALQAVVVMALARRTGIEGGIWQQNEGSLAYAFPTYEGTGPKTDLPVAEQGAIRTINTEAWSEERAVAARQTGRQQTMLLHACPLPGPIEGVTAWTMTREYTDRGAGYSQLLGGLAVLFASVLASAAWTTHLLLTWSRKLGALEAGIARHDGLDPPLLAPTGERELDRIIGGLNATTSKLRGARAEAERLSTNMAAAERLAALGRVAAGIAHEIRNPIAAMRLKAENALLGDDARRRGALETILVQITRLDGLLRDLLTLTHRSEPQWQAADIRVLLETCADLHRDVAARQSVRLVVDCVAVTWPLDPARIGRAMDNLVLNAIQALANGGVVILSATATAGALCLRVADDGPGVPDAMRPHLFEPFVTDRAEGTGLGLSIVKEIALAHHGAVSYRPGNPGSVFQLMLPLREP
ncbi:ATP-binding protein [Acidisphaera sp. L21]|uniref:sensor histidine kinase n=1 Tax=Acidisphaera sp. L21 TaxID=1641851 RepID=UPI001C2092AE|nr:ATP-binding protein [Acidisphaera sp. L21]